MLTEYPCGANVIPPHIMASTSGTYLLFKLRRTT